MMAETTTTNTGVRRWKASEQPKVASNFPVITPGKYELKLNTSGVTEKRAAPEKPPFISGSYFELADGAQKGRVYSTFFTSVTPNEKGNCITNMGGQLLDLAQATGTVEALDAIPQIEDETSGKTILDPRAVKEYLKSLDGVLVKGRVKNELKRSKDGEETTEVEHKVGNFIHE